VLKCLGIAFILGTFLNNYDPVCTLQGVMVQFASLSSVMWTFCVAFTLVEATMFSRNLRDVRKCEPFFHFICWLIPLISAILAYKFDLYGKAGGWCWIDDYDSSQRFLYFYIEVIVIFFYSIIAQIFVIKYLRQRLRSGFFNDTSTPDSLANDVSLKLRLFIFAFLLSYFFAMLHRIMDLFFILSPFWLIVIHTITVSASGFFNFTAYFISTKGKVLDWLSPLFTTCRNRKQKQQTRVISVQSPDSEEEPISEAIHNSMSIYPYYKKQQDTSTYETDSDEEAEYAEPDERKKIIENVPSSYGSLTSVGVTIQETVTKNKCWTVHQFISLFMVTISTLGLVAIICIIFFWQSPSKYLFLFIVTNL
jgi:hypothetical protein